MKKKGTSSAPRDVFIEFLNLIFVLVSHSCVYHRYSLVASVPYLERLKACSSDSET